MKTQQYIEGMYWEMVPNGGNNQYYLTFQEITGAKRRIRGPFTAAESKDFAKLIKSDPPSPWGTTFQSI